VDDPMTLNRRAWDEAAVLHAQGNDYYPVERFKAGQVGATPNIPDDLGDVRGRRLLHLQCHFGMDSLLWVRQEAVVTGVDFSPMAIAKARQLASEVGLAATFLEADVCNLPENLGGQFDIVLTYCGTFIWLGDLAGWARGIARSLAPGGFFYLADFHPQFLVMEVPTGETILRPRFEYFGNGRPIRSVSSGTYAVPDAPTENNVTYEWQHTTADLVCALADAGLRLDYLHEFPYCFDDGRKQMRQDERGWWHLVEGEGLVPLMLSIKAIKPG
jgi:SAM-dependent methyltransferase